MVGKVGRDDFAKALLKNLADSNIDRAYVMRDDQAATGVALIVVDDQGENTIVVASGANMQLSVEDVEKAKPAITNAGVLLLQLEIPLDSVLWAAELAKTHGVSVVLNPAPARQLPDGLLSLVDVLIPNETEITMLTGITVESQQDRENAARALLDKGVRTVVLTMGASGALLAEKDTITQVHAFKVNPVDTTAAGDAFVGGFGVALAEGKSLSEAMRWGNAAGALAATKLGAQTSLPTRAEVMALLS
jgi:ribokinase